MFWRSTDKLSRRRQRVPKRLMPFCMHQIFHSLDLNSLQGYYFSKQHISHISLRSLLARLSLSSPALARGTSSKGFVGWGSASAS